jgi:hypothetical protein
LPARPLDPRPGDPKAIELILVVNNEIFSAVRRDWQAGSAPRVHHDPVKRRRLHLRTIPGHPGRESGPWTNRSAASSSGAAASLASSQTRPLIDHATAERWQLRRELAPEAHRLALAVMWDRYGDDEAEAAALDALSRVKPRFVTGMQECAVAFTFHPQSSQHLVRCAIGEAMRRRDWLQSQARETAA